MLGLFVCLIEVICLLLNKFSLGIVVEYSFIAEILFLMTVDSRLTLLFIESELLFYIKQVLHYEEAEVGPFGVHFHHKIPYPDNNLIGSPDRFSKFFPLT
jgi:hypothetical protein